MFVSFLQQPDIYPGYGTQPRLGRQRIVDQYDEATFISVFLGGFAMLALLLAAIGIYGVMSYTVAPRRHEIGIRIALGADRARILRLVWGHGIKLTVAGVIVAAVLSAALHRVLVWLTFGVATSPATAVDAARALRSE